MHHVFCHVVWWCPHNSGVITHHVLYSVPHSAKPNDRFFYSKRGWHAGTVLVVGFGTVMDVRCDFSLLYCLFVPSFPFLFCCCFLPFPLFLSVLFVSPCLLLSLPHPNATIPIGGNFQLIFLVLVCLGAVPLGMSQTCTSPEIEIIVPVSASLQRLGKRSESRRGGSHRRIKMLWQKN